MFNFLHKLLILTPGDWIKLICRSIREHAKSVMKKIGDKLSPDIKRSLDNAVTMEEVDEVVIKLDHISYQNFTMSQHFCVVS